MRSEIRSSVTEGGIFNSSVNSMSMDSPSAGRRQTSVRSSSPTAPAAPPLSASWPYLEAVPEAGKGKFRVLLSEVTLDGKGNRSGSMPTQAGNRSVTVYMDKKAGPDLGWRNRFQQAVLDDLNSSRDIRKKLHQKIQCVWESPESKVRLLRVPNELVPLTALAHSKLGEFQSRLLARLVIELPAPARQPSASGVESSSSSSSAAYVEPITDEASSEDDSPVDPASLQAASGAAKTPTGDLVGVAGSKPVPQAKRLRAAFNKRFEVDKPSSHLIVVDSKAAGASHLKRELFEAASTEFTKGSRSRAVWRVKINCTDRLIERLPAERILHILFGDLNSKDDVGGGHLHPHQYPYVDRNKHLCAVPAGYAWHLEREFWNARVDAASPKIHAYFPKDFTAGEILAMAFAELESLRQREKSSSPVFDAPLLITRQRFGLPITIKLIIDKNGSAADGLRIKTLYPHDKASAMLERLAETYAEPLALMGLTALREMKGGEAYNALVNRLKDPDVAQLDPIRLKNLIYHVEYIGCLLRVVCPERYEEPEQEI